MIAPPPRPSVTQRADVLRQFGAEETDLDALLAYTDNPFDLSGPLVLEDEPFAPVWEEYLAESETEGVFPVLQRVLHQLRFPVREGMSESELYRAATRRGELAALGDDGAVDGGLRLAAPDRLRLELHTTPAGRIPVLTAPVREDFVALVQALTRRNEPVELPPTMGALMVSGYNNWDRVRRYRQRWEAGDVEAPTWAEAFRQLIPQKALYQDRFILLSEGPYSGVPASAFGLQESEWVQLSHVIRREHECAHYYCRRVLGAMQTNVLDEWIADAAGVLAAGAPDPAHWLRVFLTDERTGRLGTYSRELSPSQRHVIRRLLADLAQRTDWDRLRRGDASPVSAQRVRSLASGTLEEQWLRAVRVEGGR